jgi:hypothetical protein
MVLTRGTVSHSSPVQFGPQNVLMHRKMLLDVMDVPALPSVRLKTRSERLV